MTDIKCTQTTISKDLDKMRTENNILYRDMSSVIEKTDQQQNILEKVRKTGIECKTIFILLGLDKIC